MNFDSRIVKLDSVNWRDLPCIQHDTFKELTDKAFRVLENSLFRNKFIMPFFVWENGGKGYILDGFHRKKVMLQMEKDGYLDENNKRHVVSFPDMLPAIFIDCENEQDAAKVVLALSSKYAYETGEGMYEFMHKFNLNFDDIRLTTDFPKIDFEEFEMEFLKDIAPEEIEGGTQAIPKVPKDAITKKGQLIELNSHRLLIADSTEQGDVDRLMNSRDAKLLFTSPPYSDQREYEDGIDLSIAHLKKFAKTFGEYTSLQCVNLGLQVKDGEVIPYWDEYKDYFKQLGYKLLSWSIWNRGEPRSIGQQTAFIPIAHEWVFVFGIDRREIKKTKKSKLGNQRTQSINRNKDGSQFKRTYVMRATKKMNTVVNIGVSSTGEHPAMFPPELPVEYIEAMTERGDIIAEPFCGGGSTVIACEQTGRICYGMEIVPGYGDVIIARYARYMRKLQLERGPDNVKINIVVDGKKLTEEEISAYIELVYS